MSFARVWRWTCDRCSVVVDVIGFGLPRSWLIVRGEGTEHVCDKCGDPLGRSPSDFGGVYADDEPVAVLAWRTWAETLAHDIELQTDADDFPPEQWDDADLREGIRAALLAAGQALEALAPLVPPDALPMVLRRRH